jgi:hypothetical protein
MVVIKKSYEAMQRAMKDALLREMNRYVLPYVCDPANPNKITESQFRADWDTYMRPMIFDLFDTPMNELGMTPSDGPTGGDPSDPQQEHQFNWSADFWDSSVYGKNDYLRLDQLTIPYSGPFEDLREYTPNRQNLGITPWIESDEVGDIVPGWYDIDGNWHPPYYEGYYDISGDGESIQASIENDCHTSDHSPGTSAVCTPSRIYRIDTPGRYANFYHEFKHKHVLDYRNLFPITPDTDFPFPTIPVYCLHTELDHGYFLYSQDNIGIWSILSNTSPGYILKCGRDRYYNGNNTVFGYGRQFIEMPNFDPLTWEQLSHWSYKDLRITIERRDNTAIFVFWKRTKYYTTQQPTNNRTYWNSLPWPIKYHGTAPGGNFYENWLGMGSDPYTTTAFHHGDGVISLRVTNESMDIGLPKDHDDRNYYYPIEIVRIRVDPAHSFNHVYVANYQGYNDYDPFDYTSRYSWPVTYTFKELDFYEFNISDGIDLFIDGGAYINDNISMHTNSETPVYPLNSLITTYIKGNTLEDMEDTIPLFMSQMTAFNNFPMLITGVAAGGTANHDVFIPSIEGLEDFTTYTMVDEASQAADSYSYTRIAGNALVNDGDLRWHKDYGENFFNIAWRINFEFEWSGDGNVDFVPIQVTNTVTDLLPFATCTEETVAFYYDQTAGTWKLEAFAEGESDTFTSPIAGKHYWGSFGRRGNDDTKHW